eukprot:314045-Prymnesium_polylepis.2
MPAANSPRTRQAAIVQAQVAVNRARECMKSAKISHRVAKATAVGRQLSFERARKRQTSSSSVLSVDKPSIVRMASSEIGADEELTLKEETDEVWRAGTDLVSSLMAAQVVHVPTTPAHEAAVGLLEVSVALARLCMYTAEATSAGAALARSVEVGVILQQDGVHIDVQPARVEVRARTRARAASRQRGASCGRGARAVGASRGAKALDRGGEALHRGP